MISPLDQTARGTGVSHTPDPFVSNGSAVVPLGDIDEMQLGSAACFQGQKRSSGIGYSSPKKRWFTEKKGSFGEGNPSLGKGGGNFIPSDKHKIMKQFFTLIALFLCTLTLQAQDDGKVAKMEAPSIGVDSSTFQGQRIRKDRSMARLYKFKNSKVKKALSFSTKKNRSKLA